MMKFETEYMIYRFINKHPLLTDEEIATELGIKNKKVYKGIKSLLKQKLIQIEWRTERNSKCSIHVSRVYRTTSFGELINWDEMKHTKKKNEVK